MRELFLNHASHRSLFFLLFRFELASFDGMDMLIGCSPMQCVNTVTILSD